MSAKVTFQMFINGREAVLSATEKGNRLRALERGEKEAQTHRQVVISEQHDDGPPWTLASWNDGHKTTG